MVVKHGNQLNCPALGSSEINFEIGNTLCKSQHVMPNLVYQDVYHRCLEVDRTLENYLNDYV